MFRLLLPLLLLGLLSSLALAEDHGIDNPLHGYYTNTPTDRFTQFKTALEAGEKTLDLSGELALLRSLLAELQIPISSQSMVFSVTSLQKNLISPRRPRALYFNDDTYVAFVPGGRLEVISLDPKLGSIFYISDRVRPGRVPRMERTEECFNCHAPAYLQNIPALLVESVIPGMTGGGERAFRRERTGHDIPLEQRFGGWHVTGTGEGFPQHQGNKIIQRAEGVAHEIPTQIGDLFEPSYYLLPTSNILPQLIQEHQVGFANRAMLAGYRTREFLAQKPEQRGDLAAQLSKLAEPLVRYLLFADEVPLPAASVPGDAEYKAAFLANRRPNGEGAALKDLDLSTRLFKHRCSYMVYTPLFTGLPPELKSEVYAQLAAALSDSGSKSSSHLPAEEKRTIRSILQQTLPDLPPTWSQSQLASGESR